MGLARLWAFLRRRQVFALDTSIFIYQLEENVRYVSVTDPVFAWLEHREHSALTSTITMTELLVKPYREPDEHTVNEFYALLATYPNLDWIAPSLDIADIAARLRAQHRLCTPDALQAVTAVKGGATGLIANDGAFARLDAFRSARSR